MEQQLQQVMSLKGTTLDLDSRWVAKRTTTYVGPQFTEHAEDYVCLTDFFGSERQTFLRTQLQSFICPISPGFRMLEVGAGHGQFSRALLDLDLCPSIYLINDISPQMLRRCKANLSHEECHRNGLFFLEGDVEEFAFVEGVFDVIIGGSVLHHLMDYHGFLRKIYEMLKPAGRCIFQEPLADPYLLAVYLIKMSMAISEMGRDAYSTSEIVLLDSFCRDILTRSSGAVEQEVLAALDDKHLFSEHQLRGICRGIGFSHVEVMAPGDEEVVSGGRPPSSHAYNFLRDIFLGLGVQVRDSMKLQTGMLDSILPHLFLGKFAPQHFIRLIK